ncbi:MAG: hypothetical protein ACLR07_11010 [Christensenellales bacterium]
MGGFFLLFLCVCVRLVDLQIVRQKELTARGVKQWTRSGVVSRGAETLWIPTASCWRSL